MKAPLTFLFVVFCFFSQAQSVTLVKDIRPGAQGGVAAMFDESVIFNNRLYFFASAPESGYELWSTDGTEQGTTMLKDIYEGPEPSIPQQQFYSRYPGIVEFDNYLYFAANNWDYGEELWRTDGTEANTSLVMDFNEGGGYFSSNPAHFHVFGDKMFLTAYKPDIKREAYILSHNNDLPEITFLGDICTDNSTLGDSWNNYSPLWHNKLVSFLNSFIFTWSDCSTGQELWTTNGTPEGTEKLFDFYAIGNGNPSNYHVLQESMLLFTAYSEQGHGLWKMTANPFAENGFEVELLKIFVQSTPVFKDFYIHNDQLYFAARDEAHGTELWVTDGTADGTHIVKDIIEGTYGSAPTNFVSYGGHLYFTVYDYDLGTYGHIWRTDGTEEGTVDCSDVWTSNITRSTYAMKWKEYNGKLYMPCYRSDMPVECLAVYDGSDAGPQWLIPSNGGGLVKIWNDRNEFIEYNDELYFVAERTTTNFGTELYKLTASAVSSVSNEGEAIKFSVYPNPVANTMNVTVDGNMTSATLSVYDVAGKRLMSKTMNQSTLSVDTESWAQGVYFLQMKNHSSSKTIKVIKN